MDKQIGDGMPRGRTGVSSPLGKLTADVRIKVDEETRDELDRLAVDAGMGLSEFIRELLMIRVHGRDRVARLHKARLALVAGVGMEEGD